MKFDLIRLVLVSKNQTSLFPITNSDGKELNREEWLRHALANELIFTYRKQEFYFVQQNEEGSKFITGKVGRKRTAIENTPPEEGFDTIKRDHWLACLVLIDPTHHEDGQKFAIEINSLVGQSIGIVRALADCVNDFIASPYIIEANAIADKETFWDFERRNRGEIVSISFDLVAPNMFGIREAIDQEMAELRDTEKAVNTVITLKNPNGLDLETDRVRQTVNYTTEGGGTIRARTKKKRTYNSESKIKRVTVEEIIDVDTDTLPAMIARALDRVFLVLGMLSVDHPLWLSDDNSFLKDFIGANLLNVLGVILAITIASVAQLHLEFNKAEERYGRRGLEKSRQHVRGVAYALIVLFCASVAALIVKPILGASAQAQAIVNAIEIYILFLYVLMLVELTQGAFAIRSIIEPPNHNG